MSAFPSDPSHLSDVAALEWARSQNTRLAPEAPDEVRIHLTECAECQAKVDAFIALERSMHPYGSAAPVDHGARKLRLAARVALIALCLGLTYVLYRQLR